jgi:protein-tyrosine-phosphatase
MRPEKRKFGLGIWGLSIGYFVFYLPYVALVKATTKGLLSGVEAPSSLEMMPATGIGTVVVMTLIITAMGWWKYAGRVRLFGLSVPCPRRLTLISGVATAAIIYTTTLVFTFRGVSILLAILMLRGGVLLLAPVVDIAFKRRVRWFSWMALALTLLAGAAVFSDVSDYHMTFAVVLTVAVYLTGYAVRLPCINSLAKTAEPSVTYRYFVEEQMVAMAALMVVPGAIALFGSGSIATELRSGYTSFFATSAIWPSLFIGALYACLCYFGTRIYLDRRENTFCIPLNRCSSLLSAIVASYGLTLVLADRAPGTGELAGAVLVIIAILFLSPLHHFRLWPRREMVKPMYMDGLRGVFLFVCSGNTSRSPMAQAICTQEIARRLKISADELSSHNVTVISAGLAARPGSPMKRAAQQALERLRVSSGHHASQSLTPQMAERADRIFCMTQSHRQRVIEDFLVPPNKVQLLDPQGDIEEPQEIDSEAFLNCASRIWKLISKRLDESAMKGPALAEGTT